MTPSEFWALTKVEYVLAWQGHAQRAQRERDRDMSLAWHAAALSRVDKMPPLSDLLSDAARPKATPELLAQMQADHEELTARLGGGGHLRIVRSDDG